MSDLEEKSKPAHEERDLDEGMKAVTQLFSTPEVKAKAHLRCGIHGPTEIEVILESALDDVFGYNPNSDYKCWIRRLYTIGLISHVPDDWKV